MTGGHSGAAHGDESIGLIRDVLEARVEIVDGTHSSIGPQRLGKRPVDGARNTRCPALSASSRPDPPPPRTASRFRTADRLCATSASLSACFSWSRSAAPSTSSTSMRPTSACCSSACAGAPSRCSNSLLPIELELDAGAADALRDIRDRLGRIGIMVELEKGRPRRITALAEPLHQLPADWLAEYVAGMRGSEADLERAVLADIACKLAVKDGEVLDQEAAAAIARESFAIDLQHCPHGRPLWYSVTRAQVSARVGRPTTR